MASKRYYVLAETRKGQVVAYTVNDCVGDMESEHSRYEIEPRDKAGVGRSAAVCLHLANLDRDDRNDGLA